MLKKELKDRISYLEDGVIAITEKLNSDEYAVWPGCIKNEFAIAKLEERRDCFEEEIAFLRELENV